MSLMLSVSVIYGYKDKSAYTVTTPESVHVERLYMYQRLCA